MGHVRLLSMKVLMSSLPVFLILTFVGELYWLTAMVVSLVLGLIAYALGDLFILPASGNLIATIADGGLVFAFLYLLQYVGIQISTNTIIYSVIAVLLVEGLVFHPYLKRLVTMDSMEPRIGKRD